MDTSEAVTLTLNGKSGFAFTQGHPYGSTHQQVLTKFGSQFTEQGWNIQTRRRDYRACLGDHGAEVPGTTHTEKQLALRTGLLAQR